MAKFTFDTIQPYVEMLIDALENRGSSSSGFPYDPNVLCQAELYRKLLARVRENEKLDISVELKQLHTNTIQVAGNNQIYRIRELLKGLDFFMIREYNKYSK